MEATRWNLHWTGQQDGRDQKKVMFISAYKLCTQNNDNDSTVTAQHKWLLTLQGEKNSNLRKAFNQDILEEIRK
eukprot:13003315-Ditylum_brightwellii.AAC.1